MPLATSTAPVFRSKTRVPKTVERKEPSRAITEIRAFIAIRDNLLAEAEKSKAKAKLDSVTVANEFVQSCLKPARSPYQAQCLPESEAARERKRCEVVKHRVTKLRAQASL